MRAIVNTPEGPGRIELRDGMVEPAPEPDQALVAVEAVSINRGELALLSSRPAGWQPGQDIAGTVLAAATDGSGPRAGSRVVGLVEGAGWAEQAAVRVRQLAELPEQVDTASAATLPIAGRTALRTVALGGNLLGRRVLVTGAAGGVGRFQVQIAALAGAEVTAVTRRTDLRDDLLGLGATSIVEQPANADGLFDLVLDAVGGRQISSAVAKVAPGGTVVLIGASDPEPAQLSLLDFAGHENAILRSYFSYAQPDTIDCDLASLVRLLADHRLTPHIGLRSSWTDTNAALDAFAAGRVDGKAVLDVHA